ncbi:MAG TPA: zinc-dependent metalloprotease [Thermoanaerobaculia bacterium]|nr:zinc-dependent metalloprotease [Thermoanaerobaculia bacterium]
MKLVLSQSTRRALTVLVLLAAPAATAPGKAVARAEERIAAKVQGLAAKKGLLTIYPDPRHGRLWLELPAPGPDGVVGSYLYVHGLLRGVGSNPIGLDRGQLGTARVLTLRRLGPRVLFEQENLRYRAVSDNPAERRAMAESFAGSVLWAGEIAAEEPDGRILIDLSGFLLRDAHGVVATLKQAGEGSFSLDPSRSAIDLGGCLAFPDNLELEALLTFAGNEPGPELAATVPAPQSVTVVQHQSLIRLPDAGYTPRLFDPRTGSYAETFADYAVPLDRPIERRYLVRHRLQKVDPTAARSAVKKPIVYYVDQGAPEPVRSALVEGARWWARAFEEAGFLDAYRVELLPEGAHPLDVRYNVIQWVHRATRGWSYGGGVIDPRTGEMVKGHVTLGSLRVRQDRLLFEGLLGTARTGSGAPEDPVQLSLARIRQLAAHEVGHALGFAHNFAASTWGGRASVMDYPAPWIRVTVTGDLDPTDAYGVGVGEWDRHAVRYAYGEFPPGTDEAAALAAIASEGVARGLHFLTDEDARPLGSAHPLAHLWDNGEDAAEELLRTLEVRRIALSRFGAGNLAAGRPLALLEEVFATVYLHHRYQLEAAGKLIAGLDYRHALAGDGDAAARPVPAAAQRRALAAVLAALEPERLDVPEGALALLLPRPPEHPPNREMFGGATRPAFDALGAAATAADLALAVLLEPARATRLVDQSRRDGELPGLGEVLDRLSERVFSAAGAAVSPRLAEVSRAVQAATVRRLGQLWLDPRAPMAVKARVGARLERLGTQLRGAAGETEQAVHDRALGREIERLFEHGTGAPVVLPAAAAAPPGQPIGSLASEDPGCSWEEAGW